MMGKATNRKKQPRKTNPVDRILGPTEARLAHNDARRAGMAYRMIPMIETLLTTGQINQREFDALSYYRDQASRAEDDMAQEGTLSLSRVMGGSGSTGQGKIPAILMATPAILETARIERDLGSARELVRRVCVDDWSLSKWAVEQSGGRERYDGKGKLVAIVPIDTKAVERARLQLRYAAGAIVR